jgi:DNA-binding NarL/FixJ family response regulator
MRNCSGCRLPPISIPSTVDAVTDPTDDRSRCIVVHHQHALVREGIDVAIRSRSLAYLTATVAFAADVANAISTLRATACIVDLGAEDAGDLPQLLTLRAIGVCETFDVMAARRAFAVGIRAVAKEADGLDALLATLGGGDGSSASFAASAPGEDMLNPFERAVLQLIGEGMTARSVAIALGVSASRVDAAKRRCFSKLGVQHQSHAVAVALRRGLLPAPNEVPLVSPDDHSA